MSKDELENSLRTLDILLIVFGLFVAIGVTGESVFGFMHWRKSNQLRGIQSAENLAQERGIERLKKESENIRLDTAKAVERAANAEREAEQERLARLKIEDRLAARRVSPDQRHDLIAALSPYQGSVVKLVKLGDFEAGRFADDIILVLTESGWKVQTDYSGTISPPVYGVRCTVNKSPSGKVLGAAFRTLPSAHVESSPRLPTSAAIIVGLKTPP